MKVTSNSQKDGTTSVAYTCYVSLEGEPIMYCSKYFCKGSKPPQLQVQKSIELFFIFTLNNVEEFLVS